ncbi:MAG: 50S ribosomal protein L21 [Parcubacteria group bacterium GW2011_GWB1_57_6]|nr:MAG: 50S ribosomal protein L21 [Parcubacteria group bacterium GW2011_GWB1_57_6]
MRHKTGLSIRLVFLPVRCYSHETMEVAVIKTGGKQYVVQKGDTIVIEKLPGDLKKGDTVVFGEVLLVDNGSDTTIGAPAIKGAEVKGTVVLAGLDKKVEVVKYKPKSRYYKRKGHRQPILKVKIDSIS